MGFWWELEIIYETFNTHYTPLSAISILIQELKLSFLFVSQYLEQERLKYNEAIHNLNLSPSRRLLLCLMLGTAPALLGTLSMCGTWPVTLSHVSKFGSEGLGICFLTLFVLDIHTALLTLHGHTRVPIHLVEFLFWLYLFSYKSSPHDLSLFDSDFVDLFVFKFYRVLYCSKDIDHLISPCTSYISPFCLMAYFICLLFFYLITWKVFICFYIFIWLKVLTFMLLCIVRNLSAMSKYG
jgi:hypothetical protein